MENFRFANKRRHVLERSQECCRRVTKKTGSKVLLLMARNYKRCLLSNNRIVQKEESFIEFGECCLMRLRVKEGMNFQAQRC